MNAEFKTKKLYASIIALFVGITVLYSYFLNHYSQPTLTKELRIVNYRPTLKSEYSKGGRHYWVEFQLVNDYNKVYKVSSIGLKYSLYHDMMDDLKPFDTITVEYDKENYLYSITANGKSYIDKDKLLKWERGNYYFLIYLRLSIILACLPILFFKKQPMFWHSGFEFSFRFTYLFIFIVVLANCMYFYYNGYEFFTGLDEAILK